MDLSLHSPESSRCDFLYLQDDPVEIVGFGRQLHVFTSKQLPKKLTMHCSDLTSRDFVVKVE